MTQNPPAPTPTTPTGLLSGPTISALYHAAQIERASLQMRNDAMRATLNAISHGAEHPCFTAAKAISSDDDMLAAYRIAKGLLRCAD